MDRNFGERELAHYVKTSKNYGDYDIKQAVQLYIWTPDSGVDHVETV